MNKPRMCFIGAVSVVLLSLLGPQEAVAQPRWQQSQFVVIPRLAVLAASKTELRYESAVTEPGDYPMDRASDVDQTSDADDKSLFGFGADALYQFGGQAPFRVGLGALYVPRTRIGWTREHATVDAKGDLATVSEYETWRFGSDLSVLAEAEFLLGIADDTVLALRGMGGLFVVFPGGDLQDEIDRPCTLGVTSTSGSVVAPNGNCSVERAGPFPGWTVGGGLGVTIPVGGARVRGDLLAQAYWVKLDERIDRSWDAERTTTRSMSGMRLWLSFGAEL